jgi:hypothetical protein
MNTNHSSVSKPPSPSRPNRSLSNGMGTVDSVIFQCSCSSGSSENVKVLLNTCGKFYEPTEIFGVIGTDDNTYSKKDNQASDTHDSGDIGGAGLGIPGHAEYECVVCCGI